MAVRAISPPGIVEPDGHAYRLRLPPGRLTRPPRHRAPTGRAVRRGGHSYARLAFLHEPDDAVVGLAPKCQSRAESGSSCVGVLEARQPGPPRRAGMRYRGRHQLRPGGVRRVRDWDDADTVPELQEGGAGASRGRTRGRAVVREPARSYLRPSLTYDLTQEGTTVRWGVRPRAGMCDRAIPSTGEHGSRRETLQRTIRATRTHRTTSPAPRIPAARTASR